MHMQGIISYTLTSLIMEVTYQFYHIFYLVIS